MLLFNYLIKHSVHKFWVSFYMIRFAVVLIYRAIIHDLSKYGKYEAIKFSKVAPKLKATTYGDEEYKKMIKKDLDGAIQHHYQNNSHHPEFYANGINGMNLMDFVEMFCDWQAAVRNHADGNIFNSIKFNQNRFGYEETIKNILNNEAKRLRYHT